MVKEKKQFKKLAEEELKNVTGGTKSHNDVLAILEGVDGLIHVS